jgi:hypothetical protein
MQPATDVRVGSFSRPSTTYRVDLSLASRPYATARPLLLRPHVLVRADVNTGYEYGCHSRCQRKRLKHNRAGVARCGVWRRISKARASLSASFRRRTIGQAPCGYRSPVGQSVRRGLFGKHPNGNHDDATRGPRAKLLTSAASEHRLDSNCRRDEFLCHETREGGSRFGRDLVDEIAQVAAGAR